MCEANVLHSLPTTVLRSIFSEQRVAAHTTAIFSVFNLVHCSSLVEGRGKGRNRTDWVS